MKKGSYLTGIVKRIDYPNKGIVETDEGILKVACAMPGQTVGCSVKKARNGIGEGILREVIQRSAIEHEPECPHAGKCGGCLYQSFDYADELAIKEGQVRRLLEPVLAGQSGECIIEPIVGSPVYEGYRNKMEYTFGDEYKDGPLALGMHRRGSMYDIETVSSCRITDPDYSAIIECTLDFWGSRHIPYFHKVRHTGYLRHLLVRRTRSGEILVGLVTTSGQPGTDLGDRTDQPNLIREYAAALISDEMKARLTGRICGILHIINDSLADAVKADRIDILFGEDHITESLLGLQFRISTFSFFQTNTYGAEVLYSKVREYADSLGLPEDADIFDLYTGTGTIAQIMAGGGRSVTGVEIVEEAVEAARENARINRLDGCRFIAGDVLQVLDELPDAPSLIILDPPREGIHPKALPKILSYGVEHIIYVSCKPTSLARDLELFLDAGYEVRRLCPVDQFPRTANIEVVSLLQKMSNTRERTITLDIDMEDYHRIKNRTEVTADATE